MLITDTLRTYSTQTPDKICIFAPHTSITYGAFYSQMNKLANALLSSYAENDRQKNGRIALLLENSSELLQAFLASAKIGWAAFVFDPKWTSADVTAATLDADPDVFVIQDSYLDLVAAVPQKTKIIVRPTSGLHQETHCPFWQWIQGFSDNEPTSRAEETDLFYIGYTSGTTGKPKGFMRTHRSWIESFQVSNTAFAIDQEHHVIAPGPLAHSLSLYAATATLFVGASLYLVRKFNAAALVELFASNFIEDIYLVPTMFEALYREWSQIPGRNPIQHVQNIISTGDKWLPSSKQQVEDIFPMANLFEFYGASELSFITILDPQGNKRKPESVGLPAPTVKISIRTMDGTEVKRGEVGQLYVQSNMLFAGYYPESAETNEVLHDGWGTVGDLARQDDEDFIYITGRKKNMIISGGLNIYPEEIERILLQIPDIDEVLVTGLPDTYWGEKVVALVTFKSRKSLTNDYMRDYCRQYLPAYKCPQEFIHTDSFPHTPSGKISRSIVVEELLSKRLKDE